MYVYYIWCFWVESCPQVEDYNLSEKFSAETEFCKLDPRSHLISIFVLERHGRSYFGTFLVILKTSKVAFYWAKLNLWPTMSPHPTNNYRAWSRVCQQIGRISVSWASFYFGFFLNFRSIPNTYLGYFLYEKFDNEWFVLSFGRFFHKTIWSPWSHALPHFIISQCFAQSESKCTCRRRICIPRWPLTLIDNSFWEGESIQILFTERTFLWVKTETF
jgi:hypothetical protein